MTKAPAEAVLKQGVLHFSVEGRILRELGERLVKNAEVAVVELVKNAYDADATTCDLILDSPSSITVSDDGQGMSFDQFATAWMRIGTSSKQKTARSTRYHRAITGEKGIGRFAVRFLGHRLHLETVADDPGRGYRTRLIADFHWPAFDALEDLGDVEVPYVLTTAAEDEPCGTTLTITDLRPGAEHVDLRTVRTESLGLLSPLRSLLREPVSSTTRQARDPGLQLLLPGSDVDDEQDVANSVLDAFVLRATLEHSENRLLLTVWARGRSEPVVSIEDRYDSELGDLWADIRFFPRRAGTFGDVAVDGRRAYRWITANGGVAVFDRDFRVRPYGESSDDWLMLQRDAARNERKPRSSVAAKHFAMSEEVRRSTADNWMLRLPQSAQLVGVVQVAGRRSTDRSRARRDGEGLVASADREGFVHNAAYDQLFDLVRGAVEALAAADRQIQREQEEAARQALVERIQAETADAIAEVEASPLIPAREKRQIIQALAVSAELAQAHEQATAERARQLEVMSLLGVVAGFMTHEFGTALRDLHEVHEELQRLAGDLPALQPAAANLHTRIGHLEEFLRYSTAYIRGTRQQQSRSFPVLPRLRLVAKTFGSYADDRNITVQLDAPSDLKAPPVPIALYDGLALNLFSNALKAVSARASHDGRIAFRAWNDKQWHYLEVTDTGVGIPNVLHERIFDPLFTTTDTNHDALGSGMGLGLSLVRQAARAFGGDVTVVSPPLGFSTCLQVRLPMPEQS